MTFFSKITLRRGAEANIQRQLSRDFYSQHQLLWQLFREHECRAFVYRSLPDGFLVVSEVEPTDSGQTWEIESKPYHPKLSVGLRCRFLLTANPTVKREGKRHDVYMDAKKKGVDPDTAALEWLARQGGTHGFVIVAARADSYCQNHIRRARREIRFSSLEYRGVLEVTDVDLITPILHTGLGRAKAFGCGLLMLSRL